MGQENNTLDSWLIMNEYANQLPVGSGRWFRFELSDVVSMHSNGSISEEKFRGILSHLLNKYLGSPGAGAASE